ncbi:DNA-binding transcriptional regulator BolA-like [Hydractinia symbiolongicarpus]|uniref:DNA-binding transcriptional regulator BolA-like n=1 Tax=Hydractinia symbiolongicarpus TaxID=13093 RepID=UPI00254F6C7C|nr:DNA-binding transcriptional regulator BolA-like [Hydractinia symbiolongicarpus]
MMAASTVGTVRQIILRKLTDSFKPSHLDVINESFMHNVPKDSETHFKVVIVSDEFKEKPLIQRHRLVNNVLKEEFDAGLHALSIQAKTPEQWEKTGNKVSQSPQCMGGSKK